MALAGSTNLRKKPLLQAIPVGEQHGRLGQIGLDAHPVATQHIGPIEVKGDPPKPFGLALAGDHPIAHIEPLQADVAVGIDPHPAAQPEGALGWGEESESVTVQGVSLRGQPLPIALKLQKLKLHPLKREIGPLLLRGKRIGVQLKVARHQGVVREELDCQVGAGHQIGGRPVVGPSHNGHGA